MRPCASPLCDAGCMAALDSYLCAKRRSRLRLDALDAVEVYDELVDRLAYGTGSDYEPRVRGGEERIGLDLDPAAVAARDTIAGVLSAWASLVVDKRPAARPAGDVLSAGRFVADHAHWLAGHPAAGDASEELHGLAHGAPYAVAYPNGQAWVRAVEGERCRVTGCPGEFRAIMRRASDTGQRGASLIVCDVDQAHAWLPHEWIGLIERGVGLASLVDAGAVAAALGYADTGPVYQLARRGTLTRHDTPDGPRYSLDQVRELARAWQDAA